MKPRMAAETPQQQFHAGITVSPNYGAIVGEQLKAYSMVLVHSLARLENLNFGGLRDEEAALPIAAPGFHLPEAGGSPVRHWLGTPGVGADYDQKCSSNAGLILAHCRDSGDDLDAASE